MKTLSTFSFLAHRAAPRRAAVRFALLAAAAAFGLTQPAPARAYTPAPWCAHLWEQRVDCSYFTYGQCMATVSGIGGFCNSNARFVGYADAPRRPRRPPRR
jgi:hypothetical protein